MRNAVIGAGPAGITAAYALCNRGSSVDVYEAGSTVGGMARSMRLWEQRVDLGPHRFFSRDRRVNELWLAVAGQDYVMVRRLTRILYRGKFFNYPLQLWDALAKLGPIEAASCVASYLGELCVACANGFRTLGSRSSAKERDEGGTFENWVCRRFGRRLFEIFFKTYSEKLWGIPCTDLDADFAAQRIQQFSLAAAIRGVFRLDGSPHRTLVDQFAYPTGGTGMVYARMAESIKQKGGQVFLQTPVQQLVIEQGRVKGIVLQNGATRLYDQVISSMPLTHLVARLSEAPRHVCDAARQLTFRNTILVYLEVACGNVCPDQWIYVHSPELRTGRITNFRNWVPQLYGESPHTILALEYWCDARDELWLQDDAALVKLARRELVATKLVGDEALVLRGQVYRIPKCYPVYRCGYKRVLAPIQSYLAEIRGLQVIGRYGSFKYNNQDHSILMGLMAAENILDDARHDLWIVNANYDTYQEGCRITEHGLAPAGTSKLFREAESESPA